MSTMRRARWHPPPPPTPRILNIPRRIRRKPTKQLTGGRIHSSSSRGKLESLFDQERVFSRTVPIVLLNNNGDFERRERVEDVELYRDNHNRREEGDCEEEKWRFQAEFLRSECNFLRMERDIALKKLELNRVQTKRTLRSAVETLVSGKEKMHKGNRISSVLEEEIDDLEEKLKELHRSSGVRDFEFGKCSNFDKQACVLQRRLEKLGEGLLSEEKCVKEIREMAETSLMIKTTRKVDQNFNSDGVNRFKDVESLRRKMEKLSKGMLEKMEEEYSSLLSVSSSASASASASGSSATSSASASRRIEFPLLSSSAAHVQSFLHHKEKKLSEDKTCSGRCKKIVRKIVEQVKAEMEQWTQMQDMLERVRQEMEELQTSRDFWQDRALDSDDQLQSLHSSVQEWELKAKSSETKVAELEKQMNELHLKLGKLKDEKKKECRRIPRDPQREKEKHVLICRLKENHQRSGNCDKKKESENDQWRKQQCGGSGSRSSNVVAKRLPLQDIGNFSPLWEKRISLPFAMP